MTGRDYTQVEEFMEMIVKWVFRPAISDAIELIEDPPGRKPHTSLVSLNEWYSILSAQEKELVRKVATQAADAALFGLFCAFGGVRNIGLNGEIKIVEDGHVLNDNLNLHEIYRSIATDIFE